MTGSNLSAWSGVIDNTLTILDIRNGEIKWWTCFGNCGRKDPKQKRFANFQTWSKSEIHNLLWNPNASCLVCHLTSGRYQEGTLVNQDSPLPGVSAWNGTKHGHLNCWYATQKHGPWIYWTLPTWSPSMMFARWANLNTCSFRSKHFMKSLTGFVFLLQATIKATSRRWINLRAKFFWHWRTVALPSAKCKKQTQINN